MKVIMDDEMLDAQTLRAIGHIYEGGGDYGECHSTASRIRAHDVKSWYNAWHDTAVRVEEVAKAALKKKHTISAYEMYLRASMYHRASGQFLIGMPEDTRLLPAYKDAERCFQEAIKLATNWTGEVVQIPYKDGISLSGYLLIPPGERKPRSTVVVNGGYDSVKEECYFFSGAAALRRGYNVLLFDGPGQGLPLLEQNLMCMPEWEGVLTPVVDYLYNRQDVVDTTKIAVVGISLGGYLAPRAATKEKRISALILDPPQINIGRRARQRLPLPATWRSSFPEGAPRLVTSLLSTVLERRASDGSSGWTLRRGKHVHGLSDYVSIFAELDKFVLDPAEVTCPTFVAYAEKDDLAVEAQDFYDKVGTKTKKFVRFLEAEGSGEHCECGNRAGLNQQAFDWLDELWT